MTKHLIEDNIPNDFLTFASRQIDLGKRDFYVAVSGGPDSMHVLSSLVAVRDTLKDSKKSLNLNCLHVNYNLRGEDSIKDRNLVKDYCLSHNIPIDIKEVHLDKNQASKGIQEWARSIRFEFFKEKLNHPSAILVLGHNKDDLGENVLFRLTRGSQVSNALGMKEWDLSIWRPLLNTPKTEILEHLDRKKIPYRLDVSNDKLDYSRNIIRHKIFPVLRDINPEADTNLINSLEDATEVIGYLEAQLNEELKAKQYKVSIKRLTEFPRAVATTVLRLIIKNGFKESLFKQDRSYLQKLLTKIVENKGKTNKEVILQLDRGACLLVKNEEVSFCAKTTFLEKKANPFASILTEDKHQFLISGVGEIFLPKDFSKDSNYYKITHNLDEISVFEIWEPSSQNKITFSNHQKVWNKKNLGNFLKYDGNQLRIVTRNNKNVGILLDGTYIDANQLFDAT